MTNSDFIEQTRLLVARTQQGDHKSFAQLYDMYVNQLFNFGLRLTTDRELLKDCIHDVFVKIYVKREELSEVVNFRSYLFISLILATSFVFFLHRQSGAAYSCPEYFQERGNSVYD